MWPGVTYSRSQLSITFNRLYAIQNDNDIDKNTTNTIPMRSRQMKKRNKVRRANTGRKSGRVFRSRLYVGARVHETHIRCHISVPAVSAPGGRCYLLWLTLPNCNCNYRNWNSKRLTFSIRIETNKTPRSTIFSFNRLAEPK